jgi:hypothetical protein
MSYRSLALAITSAAMLAACSDDGTFIAEPEFQHPAVAFAIVPALACNGETMPATECEAVVALYNETDGPNWTNNDGWGVDPDPCNWHGVICSAGGSVRILNLTRNGLSGPIPGALGNLPGRSAREYATRFTESSAAKATSLLGPPPAGTRRSRPAATKYSTRPSMLHLTRRGSILGSAVINLTSPPGSRTLSLNDPPACSK